MSGMFFSCDVQSLKKSIQIVEKAIASRSSLPILENIRFELKNNTLKLYGNDMEIGIENEIDIENQGTEGTFLIKAKTISNIFSKLTTEKISFSVLEDHKVLIKSDHVSYEILGTDPSEYPEFPSIESNSVFSMKIKDLKDMIKYTLFSVSSEETKQFLNGILLKNESDKFIFVSTDGYRLSLKTHRILKEEKPFQVILPQKTMSELYKILQQKEENLEINIIFNETQVVFYKKDFKLISRIIQGKFPDYNQVIPSEIQYAYQVSRRNLLEAFERSSIVASESSDIVRLYFVNNELHITANAIGLGDFKESITVSKKMDTADVRVAFNVKLFIEGLRVLESDDLLISFNSEVSPCKIESVGDTSYVYIIMPIRTSDFNQQPKQKEEVLES